MYEKLLEVRDLSVYYFIEEIAVRAVDNITLNISENEIFGVCGESGCGKTTLANSILRLIKPPARIVNGQILLNGVNLLELKEREIDKIRWKVMSYIPQGSMNSLNPTVRIEDQIYEIIQIHEKKLSKLDRKRRIEELLAKVGLSAEVARMYPHELSGGMKQRVVIAMATALNPKVIIADEPTTALDVVVQRGIIDLLLEIKRTTEASMMLITHDMAAQAEIADKIAVMYAGKVVEISNVESIFDEPLHPYTRALIQSIPSIRSKRKLLGLSGIPPDLRHPPSGCRFFTRCPLAIRGTCEVKEPEIIEFKGRLVACHLYGEGNE
ncbi:MAG: ABC transporter ATP-binding protein [Candidatus Bathyarchaeia archaeon]